MASLASLPTDEIQKLFAKDALFYIEDPIVGQRVREMQDKNFPIESEEGLDFLKQNVLNNEGIQHVLRTLFPQGCGLGIYDVYLLDSHNIYAFLTGLQTKLTAVIVQLWAQDTSMLYYSDSHKCPIKGAWASNGLLDIPPAQAKDCEPNPVSMEKGGLAIFDARLAFRSRKGLAIYFVFTEKGGPSKKFSGSESDIRSMRAKAAEMESKEIRLNFIFEVQKS